MEIEGEEVVTGALRVGLRELDQNVQGILSKHEDNGMISKGGKWRRKLRSPHRLDGSNTDQKENMLGAGNKRGILIREEGVFAIVGDGSKKLKGSVESSSSGLCQVEVASLEWPQLNK